MYIQWHGCLSENTGFMPSLYNNHLADDDYHIKTAGNQWAQISLHAIKYIKIYIYI